MTSTSRPDGGDHTALEDPAAKWPRCVGTGGRDASESVAAIVGMRILRGEKRVAAGGEEPVGGPDEIKSRDSSLGALKQALDND